jgi:hypothetical protein
MKRALLCGLLGVLVGCGAYSDNASPLDTPPSCPTIDERVQILQTLVEEGRLLGLKDALENEISADTRSRLLDVLFKIIGALPEDTFDTVGDLANIVDDALLKSLTELLSVVVDLGDPAYAAIGKVGTMMEDCTGKPLLITITELMRDEAFRADLDSLMQSGAGIQGALNEMGVDLSNSDPDARIGFQTFMRGIIAYISKPDFHVSELTGPGGILWALVAKDTPTPTLNELVKLMDRMMASGAYLTSIQQVTTCFLDVDPDSELLGLAFDVLHVATVKNIGLGGEAGASPPVDVPIDALLDDMLLPVMDLLVEDDAVRASLVVVMAAMVRPSVAVKVMPDVLVLMEEGALIEILDLFVALSAGTCG